jgi:hypothetical protein
MDKRFSKKSTAEVLEKNVQPDDEISVLDSIKSFFNWGEESSVEKKRRQEEQARVERKQKAKDMQDRIR